MTNFACYRPLDFSFSVDSCDEWNTFDEKVKMDVVSSNESHAKRRAAKKPKPTTFTYTHTDTVKWQQRKNENDCISFSFSRRYTLELRILHLLWALSWSMLITYNVHGQRCTLCLQLKRIMKHETTRKRKKHGQWKNNHNQKHIFKVFIILFLFVSNTHSLTYSSSKMRYLITICRQFSFCCRYTRCTYFVIVWRCSVQPCAVCHSMVEPHLHLHC